MQVNYRVVATGRGGTVFVETVIAVAQPGVLVNGPQRSIFTKKQVAEMVANYTKWVEEGGAPLPGYFGHAHSPEVHERRNTGQEDPALLVHKLWQEGDSLMARLEFMPWAWSKVWADGAMPYRGVSIVWNPNGKDRNGQPIGAVFGGVDVVPEPFLPVQIAAARLEDWSIGRVDATHACFAALDKDAELFRLTFKALPEKEIEMSEDNKSIEKLMTRITDLENKLQTLTDTSTKAADAHKAALTAMEARATKAEEEAKQLKAEIAKQHVAAAGAEAKLAIEQAIEVGLINVADVEGYDKGPAEAMAAFEKIGYFKTPAMMLDFVKNRFSKQSDLKAKTTKNVRMSSGRGRAAEEDADPDTAQDAYLEKVEELFAAAKKDNPQASYEDSLRFAATKFPKEYQAYLDSTGRER